MTDALEMLSASSAYTPIGVSELAATIRACQACAQACTSCADADLLEDDLGALRTCIARNLNCADICETTARVLSRTGHFDRWIVSAVIEACLVGCAVCEEECARHADRHRHCAICAQACRDCVNACRRLLAGDRNEELLSR